MQKDCFILVTFKFAKEKNKWTAYCEELGTATFGRSLEDAKKKIKEAVLCHLQTLEGVGERERFFKKHNIRFYNSRPKATDIHISLDEKVYIQPHIEQIPALSTC